MKGIRKIFLIIPILMLCGCQSIIDDGITATKNTQYALAKNSIYKFIENLKAAYQEYQYESSLGTYNSEGGITVFVNGTETKLRTNYVGDEITCNKISIDSGKIDLDSCEIYGYTFDYKDGKVIDK
jgi:hypothetical protein